MMSDYLFSLVSMIPPCVALGFTAGLLIWFVVWSICKVWSLLDIVS